MVPGHVPPPAVEADPPASATEMPPLVLAAVHLLRQCEQFVGSVPAEVFQAPSALMPGGTVGKHVRHLADHYAALVVGVASRTAVDYDHRERDVPMENDPAAAQRGLAVLARQVESLASHPSTRPLAVKVMVASDGSEATVHSSLARELAFATHHGVHHQAMMKVIAAEFGVHAHPDFGKAPSTVHHERTHG